MTSKAAKSRNSESLYSADISLVGSELLMLTDKPNWVNIICCDVFKLKL